MVREQWLVVHSPGMTTSHRTGSTLSAKRSDTKVEMIDVFPTAAMAQGDASAPTIANDHDSNSIVLHSASARREKKSVRVKTKSGI